MNPRPTPYHGVALPLSYFGTGKNWAVCCGGGRICTYVGTRPADLQSAAIDYSATPPPEPGRGFEPPTYGLQNHCSAIELPWQIFHFSPSTFGISFSSFVLASLSSGLSSSAFLNDSAASCHSPVFIYMRPSSL